MTATADSDGRHRKIECDDSGVVIKDCNEGRWRFWGLLDFHTWRWDSTYVYPNSYGESRVTERCRVCGAKREYDRTGAP